MTMQTQIVKVNGNGEGGGAENRVDAQTIFELITNGDCSRLTPKQKLQYYRAMCEAAGLDARTTPFEFVRFSDRKGRTKEILYAKKSCTDQLTEKHGVSHELLGVETVNGVHIARIRAKGKEGRFTDDIGAVSIDGLKGQELANAMMKTVTKAKRRATLSFCGLGILDESELETLQGVQRVSIATESPAKTSLGPGSSTAPALPAGNRVETSALDVLASALEAEPVKDEEDEP